MAGLIKEEGTEERALSTVELGPGLNLKPYHQALHTQEQKTNRVKNRVKSVGQCRTDIEAMAFSWWVSPSNGHFIEEATATALSRLKIKFFQLFLVFSWIFNLAVRSGGQYQQVRTRVEVASRLWAKGGHKTFNFKSNALRDYSSPASQESRI